MNYLFANSACLVVEVGKPASFASIEGDKNNKTIH